MWDTLRAKDKQILEAYRPLLAQRGYPKPLGLDAFRYIVKITFDDDSKATFLYAFHIVNKEQKEIAVFTEHCGYHVFHAQGIKVKVKRMY